MHLEGTVLVAPRPAEARERVRVIAPGDEVLVAEAFRQHRLEAVDFEIVLSLLACVGDGSWRRRGCDVDIPWR